MEWIADHFQLVVFLVIIIAYALKAMRARSESDQGGEDQPTRRTLPGEQDAAEAERTRQIQEEIRRRILARQRGESLPPPPAPEVMEEAPPPIPPPIPTPQVLREPEYDPYAQEAAERAARAEHEAAMLEAQRAMEEQLRQVRHAREMALAGVPRLPASSVSKVSTRRASALQRSIRDDLAGRGSLRRAIILREILGEPVALRSGPAGMTRR